MAQRKAKKKVKMGSAQLSNTSNWDDTWQGTQKQSKGKFATEKCKIQKKKEKNGVETYEMGQWVVREPHQPQLLCPGVGLIAQEGEQGRSTEETRAMVEMSHWKALSHSSPEVLTAAMPPQNMADLSTHSPPPWTLNHACSQQR